MCGKGTSFVENRRTTINQGKSSQALKAGKKMGRETSKRWANDFQGGGLEQPAEDCETI